MNDDTRFASVTGPTMARYLALKEALGRKFSSDRYILSRLDSFLASSGTDLTAQSWIKWCHTRNHLQSGVKRNWMRVIRNFCLYRRRTDINCFVPDASQFPPLHQPIQPHIFSENEITRLLDAVAELAPGSYSPLRRENHRLALVLLYTMGLRRGELVRLTVGDYNASGQTLMVRDSKFHKSRLLPLSSDAAREMEAYLSRRRMSHLPIAAETPLLWHRRSGGRAYTGAGFGAQVRELFRITGIRTAAGRLPRVHDFRHTFAVHALLRWYHSGADVQSKLPFLSAYMGHVSVVSTEYYLHFIEQLASAASDRFAKSCGELVTQAHLEGDVS